MYFYNVFDVVDGQPKLRKDRSAEIECKAAVENEEPNENQWDKPVTLTIFIGKDGIGLEHEVPDGYSEYTYDPQTTCNYYVGCTLDWFIRNGLDADQRDMLSVNDLTILEFALKNPEFLKP